MIKTKLKMKYNDKSLGVKQKVLYSILEIVVFSVIWMFVGPCFIDINTHSSMHILDLDNTKLCWFLYGYSLFIGGKIIYLCIRKIMKLLNKHN